MRKQVSSRKVLDLGAVQISEFAKSSSSMPTSSTVPSALYRTPVHPQPQQAGNTVFISERKFRPQGQSHIARKCPSLDLNSRVQLSPLPSAMAGDLDTGMSEDVAGRGGVLFLKFKTNSIL